MTDIGTRVVAAVALTADVQRRALVAECVRPYAVAESVFDEDDLDGCFATEAEQCADRTE